MTLAAASLALALLARADVPLPDAVQPLPDHPTVQPQAQKTHEILLDLGPDARSVPAARIAAPPPSAQAGAAAWSAFCKRANGASVLTEAGDYLGRIADPFDPESIFNPLGAYGGRLSPASIWNAAGRFGGATGRRSPFSTSGNPPLLVAGGKPIAVLTTRRDAPGAADPVTIAHMCYGVEAHPAHAPESR